MNHHVIRRLLAAVLVGLLAYPLVKPLDRLPPSPTDQDHEAAEQRRQARRAWIASRHRAAPGVDWKELEQENWRQFRNKRNKQKKAAHATRYWNEVGSSNQAGRTHATALAPDGQTLFLGTDLGGMWSASLENMLSLEFLDWQPRSDHIYGGAFHVVLLDDGSFIKTSDTGIHYSRDGGQTWNESFGFDQYTLFERGRLLKLNDANETLFLLANRWVYNNGWSSKPSALWRSTDRGQTFEELRSFDVHADIWTDRVANGPLYLSAKNRFERTTDGGDTWEVVGSLPGSTVTDTVLAGSEAGAPRFYIAKETGDDWQVYISDDAGQSWTAGDVFSDFWSRLHSFEASITNPDLLLYGGVNCYRSTDGGQSFDRINRWSEYYDDPRNKLHADIPAINFIIMPDGVETLFINTDGGTYYSQDGGETVINMSLFGLRISQYYDTFTDKEDHDLIHAGAQDQGYQTGRLGKGLTKLEQIVSGDYGHLKSPDGSLDLVYSNYPGFVQVVARNQFGFEYNWNNLDFPDVGEFPWLPFLMVDPDHPEQVYLGGDRIWTAHIEKAGPNWWEADWSKGDFDFTVSGGEYVTAMAMAPSNHERWYAVTDNGAIFVSDDRGTSWEMRNTTLPDAHYFYGTAIMVDPVDEDKLYIAGSGYTNAPAWFSEDGGTSFEPLGTGYPTTLVLEMAFSPEDNGDIYLATESGPFRYRAATDNWESLLGTQGPMTSYWSVERVDNRLRFGTHGRGIWDYYPAGVPQRNRRWLAHITPQGDFETTIHVTDTNLAGGSLTLFPFDQGGNPLPERELQVNEGFYRATSAELFAGMPVSHMAIEGSANLVVTAAYKASGDNSGGSAHVNETYEGSLRFELYQGEWDTIWDGMAILNLGDEAMSVTAIRLDEAGNETWRGTLFDGVDPQAKGLLNFQSMLEDAADEQVVIETSQTAVVTFLRGSLGGENHYLYQTAPIGDANGERWLPHVTAYQEDGGFRSTLLVSDGSLDLQPYDAAGKALTARRVEVAANGFKRLQSHELFEGEAVSHFSITGEGRLTMAYRVAPGLAGGTAHVNSNSEKGRRFVIYQGEWDSIWDGLALINPNDVPVTIHTVRRDRAGRETARKVVKAGLVPKAKVLLDFRSLLADERDQQLVIEADADIYLTFLRGPLGSSTSYLYQTLPVKMQD